MVTTLNLRHFSAVGFFTLAAVVLTGSASSGKSPDSSGPAKSATPSGHDRPSSPMGTEKSPPSGGSNPFKVTLPLKITTEKHETKSLPKIGDLKPSTDATKVHVDSPKVHIDASKVHLDPKVELKGPLPGVLPKTTLGDKLKATPPAFLTHPVDKVTLGPALKLPKDVKIHPSDLSTLKPTIDLTKVKAVDVIAKKPPVDFKIKPISLDKIALPKDALAVEKLNAKFKFGGEKFVLNKFAYKGTDYFLKFGVKTSFGWIFPGINHNHWHHCIWDPCFGCYYYYDPCLCCYYYWNAYDNCYYPCWWFVDYGTCYYPWWLCGGFVDYGYAAPSIRIEVHVGW